MLEMTPAPKPSDRSSHPQRIARSAACVLGAGALFLALALQPACETSAAVGAAATSAPATKAGSPSPADAECRWAEGKITIDGNASEPAWDYAQVFTNFHMGWLGAGDRPAKTATRARLLWDNDHLYFHADMVDSDLFADVTEKDGDTWNNDCFEIFLKPSPTQGGYYEFHVNAANTQFDLYLPKRGGWLVNRLRRDQPFHIESQVVRRGTLNQWRDKDEGWSVEGRIPWSRCLPTSAAS